MNDPRRPGGAGPGPQGPQYPPPVDPAYAEEARYAPSYGTFPPWAPSPYETNSTRELPPYWQQDLQPSGELPGGGLAPGPPNGQKSPRWLWIGAGIAALVAVALVIALVLANDAIKTQTAVPPLPAMPESSSSTPTTTSTRTAPLPPMVPAPMPPSDTATPSETTGSAAMQSVVYNVTGDGRAISVMYIDTGDVVQTEFNVALPWNKQVSLSKSAAHPANVTVVNIGHNVTCSVTVDGVQVSRRVGVGITICDARE
ncbi:MmpS family transport accessory protein [Mycobacterium sp.]|uniref:MmpS family transport accessory protein n=1 Tax=Mycobacterium sp. TaxID=1785 RepID=UPI0025FDD060|nr:MmpS family transport accessory protein [Mycobacterium sp.]MBW0014442.1 hypothetical protein [Mycobacterium sp.]